MDKPLMILVGGFLGAGKTTLLDRATKLLVGRGRHVGLITNDQADNLVDTLTLQRGSSPVREVSGGCFCCLFENLIDSMNQLVSEYRPDILIGEPVGSCTDLSATVVQPIKALHSGEYRLAPLTVLVDPDRIRFLTDPSPLPATGMAFPENVLYIYLKQLEEADVIVLNKSDLLPEERRLELEYALRRRFSRARVMSISAKAGTGIDAWLDFVLHSDIVGRTVTDVDYDVYADGEAALGWLNASYRLQAEPAADWQDFCLGLIAAMRSGLLEQSAEIAHLKIHLKSGPDSLIGNLITTCGEPSWRGRIDRRSTASELLINARVHMMPEALRTVVDRCIGDVAGANIRVDVNELRCFAPSRPQPTHRYANAV